VLRPLRARRRHARSRGRWEPPELPGDALEALIEEHRGRGIEPDGQTAGARWKSEEDIPSEVYFAASEPLL
jgi:hypothetical protein